MKTTNLTIAIDKEKLTALRQYAEKKEVDIDTEIIDAVDKLYEKYVPAAVREYIAERGAAAPKQSARSSRPRVTPTD